MKTTPNEVYGITTKGANRSERKQANLVAEDGRLNTNITHSEGDAAFILEILKDPIHGPAFTNYVLGEFSAETVSFLIDYHALNKMIDVAQDNPAADLSEIKTNCAALFGKYFNANSPQTINLTSKMYGIIDKYRHIDPDTGRINYLITSDNLKDFRGALKMVGDHLAATYIFDTLPRYQVNFQPPVQSLNEQNTLPASKTVNDVAWKERINQLLSEASAKFVSPKPPSYTESEVQTSPSKADSHIPMPSAMTDSKPPSKHKLNPHQIAQSLKSVHQTLKSTAHILGQLHKDIKNKMNDIKQHIRETSIKKPSKHSVNKYTFSEPVHPDSENKDIPSDEAEKRPNTPTKRR